MSLSLKVRLNVYVTWSKKACKRKFVWNWISWKEMYRWFWWEVFGGSAIKMLGYMHTLEALIYILFFFKLRNSDRKFLHYDKILFLNCQMICILTVSYSQAFIEPELELLYDKDIQLNLQIWDTGILTAQLFYRLFMRCPTLVKNTVCINYTSECCCI